MRLKGAKEAKIKSVKTEKAEEELELKSIWPQLSKVISWHLNQFDKAVELLK